MNIFGPFMDKKAKEMNEKAKQIKYIPSEVISPFKLASISYHTYIVQSNKIIDSHIGSLLQC